MTRKFLKYIKDEKGVTLVELLAAIAILSIIVTAFLAFFIQAANTNSQTNHVNEATFLAQEEMEKVTHYSNENQTVEAMKEALNFENNTRTTNPSAGVVISTDLTGPNEESDLYKIVVEVREGGKLRAKMETRLPFAKTTSE